MNARLGAAGQERGFRSEHPSYGVDMGNMTARRKVTLPRGVHPLRRAKIGGRAPGAPPAVHEHLFIVDNPIPYNDLQRLTLQDSHRPRDARMTSCGRRHRSNQPITQMIESTYVTRLERPQRRRLRTFGRQSNSSLTPNSLRRLTHLPHREKPGRQLAIQGPIANRKTGKD